MLCSITGLSGFIPQSIKLSLPTSYATTIYQTLFAEWTFFSRWSKVRFFFNFRFFFFPSSHFICIFFNFNFTFIPLLLTTRDGFRWFLSFNKRLKLWIIMARGIFRCGWCTLSMSRKHLTPFWLKFSDDYDRLILMLLRIKFLFFPPSPEGENCIWSLFLTFFLSFYFST